MRRLHRAVVVAGLCLAGVACARDAAREPRPLVVVSVLPQQYFAQRIAGDLARVEVMLPPGASPASYEPTLSQLRALSQAALYVKVGHPHFPFEEAWLDRLVADSGVPVVVDASAGIAVEGGDPHLWLAPAHARSMARSIHLALRAVLPGHETALDAGLADLLAEIDAVDAELRELLRDKRGATFVVFHPAWGHLAEAYGLEQLAIEADRKEPDPKRLAEVIERARRLGVRVVFTQPHFDASSARVVANEIGAVVEPLDPLAYDWPANLRHVGRRLADAART